MRQCHDSSVPNFSNTSQTIHFCRQRSEIGVLTSLYNFKRARQVSSAWKSMLMRVRCHEADVNGISDITFLNIMGSLTTFRAPNFNEGKARSMIWIADAAVVVDEQTWS